MAHCCELETTLDYRASSQPKISTKALSQKEQIRRREESERREEGKEGGEKEREGRENEESNIFTYSLSPPNSPTLS